MRNGVRWGGAAMALVFVGCGGELPPYDELPLRDTLLADSRAIATLAPDARARLAARFEAARTGGALTVQAPGEALPAPLVRAVDAPREQANQDALVAYSVRGMQATVYHAEVAADAHPTGRLTVTGEPPAETEALEARALGGRAGAIVEALQRASGASQLVRVNGWPVGVVVVGDGVYINGAWLAAMAPEEPAAMQPPLSLPQGAGPGPGAFANNPGGPADAGAETDAGTTPTPPGSGSGSSGSGCGPCCSCNTACERDACRTATGERSGRDGCESCSGCRSCSGGSCAVTPENPVDPWWSASRLLGLLAPLGFVLWRARRKA